MKREPVNSDAVKTVGYDPTQQLLDIEWSNGSVWRYFKVPPHIHRELLAASSIGRYVNSAIKGTYASKNITGEPEDTNGLLVKYPETARFMRLQEEHGGLLEFSRWLMTNGFLKQPVSFSTPTVTADQLPAHAVALFCKIDRTKLKKEQEAMVEDTLNKLKEGLG